MFHVEKMSDDDFEFAVDLTDSVDWGFVEDDFKFMMRLEPEGCFVLYNDEVKIGIATTISYDGMGWFGNLIVEHQHRGKGAGAFLVRHALKYLVNKGANFVGLYSYVSKVPFYESLGFTRNIGYKAMRAEKLSPSELLKNNSEIQEASKQDLKNLVEYDKGRFGADRGKLLKAIMAIPRNMCYLSYKNSRLRGYIMAKVYKGVAEIGPLVCERKKNNLELGLLQAVFGEIEGYDVSLCLPEKESNVLDFLQKWGFVDDFPLTRMFFNRTTSTEAIASAESLERG